MDNPTIGKKYSGIALAALLIFGAVAVAFMIPQTAYAAVTITSSANTFFGPSLVRIEVKDDALVGTPADIISIRVAAKEAGSELGFVQAQVNEIGTSGTFELFVTTSESPVNPANPTFTGGPVAAHVVRISAAPAVGGDGTNDFIIPLGAGNFLEDGNTIEINYGGQTKVINFAAANAVMTSDRLTAGNGNEIVLALADSDGNVDPTAVDTFPASGTFLTSTNPITFASAPAAVWQETGQNSGVFELTVNVNTPATVADTFITSGTLPTGNSFTATDGDVYATIVGATTPYTAPTFTTSTSSASVTLENKDAIISTPSDPSFTNGVKFTITDADRNISTKTADTPTGVFVELDNAIVQADHEVDYTAGGAVVTTAGAEAAGSVVQSQLLTFSSDPGTILTTDITRTGVTGTGVGVTVGTTTFGIGGTGSTRTVTATTAFTTAGAVTDIALGTLAINVAGIDNNVALATAASTGAPLVSGGVGTVAGVGNAQVTAVTDASAGAVTTIPMEETGDSTGIFVPDVTDNKVPLNLGPTTTVTATGITLNPLAVAQDPEFHIVFFDPAVDPTGAETFSLIKTLGHNPGTFTAPTNVQVTDKFAATLNDGDLNTNMNTAETYTAVFAGGTTAPVPLNLATLGPDMNTLGITFDNLPFSVPPGFTITLIETGPNTGIFTASSIDMQVLTSGLAVEDGDLIEFTYTDRMETPAVDSDATISIGSPSATIDIDRTTLPIPMVALAAVAPYPAIPADTVTFTVTVTDPVANTNTASTDTVTVGLAMQTSGGAAIALGPAGVINVNNGNPVQLTETGVSTGVFTKDITMAAGTAFNINTASGAKLILTYGSETASATLKSFDLSITTSKTAVRSGDTLIVTFTDADRNLDSGAKDTIQFNIQAIDDDQTLVTMTADETGPNTGVFTETIVVGTDMKISTTAGGSVSAATQVEIKTRDRVASDLTNPVVREKTISITTGTGTITVIPENPGPGTKVKIQVGDLDLDTSPTATETIAPSADILKVTTDRSGIGTWSLGAKETGGNTGIFEHEVTFTPLPITSPPTAPSVIVSGDESDITVLPGDIVSFRYTDETNSAGSKVTVSKTIKIVSVDPKITSNQTSVNVGESFNLTIDDSDANLDGDVIDTVKVRVTSNSDAVGFETTLIETGPNTGVFTGTLQTTEEVEAGSVSVTLGDVVSIEYEDKFPADYADRVETVLDPSKDFTFTIPVGISAGNDPTATSPSPAQLVDLNNNAITSPQEGQQVVISSKVQNNQGAPRPAAVIVEVRDAEGFTVYLQWQTAVIPASDAINVGLSWTPDAPGTYTIRTFVVSSVSVPAVLSEVATSTVTVS